MKGVQMKRFMLLIPLLFLCGIVATEVCGEPWSCQFDPDSNLVLGAVTATTATQKIPSNSFYLKWCKPVYISVVVVDSGAGNGAATDSLAVTLQKGFQHTSSDVLQQDSVWIDVNTLAAFDPTKTFDIHHYISQDSIDLGAYQIGGIHRLVLHRGGGQTLDTVNGDYTIKVFVTQEGMD